MASELVALATVCLFVCASSLDPSPTFEAAEALLELSEHIDISTVEDNAIPIYRKDLPHDYVAYWQFVINDDEQVIVASGAETGDNRIALQGPLPTMTHILDDTASSHGESCARYYMLTPDVTMMCENDQGHIVATTRDNYIVCEDNDDDATPYQCIEDHLNDLQRDWRERAREVEKDDVWDETLQKTNDDGDDDNFIMTVLSIGDVMDIPVMGGDVNISAVVRKGNDDDTRLTQNILCDIVNICEDGEPQIVDATTFQTTTYGQRYLSFTIGSPTDTNLKELEFVLRIEVPQEGIVCKRFLVDLKQRQKRAVIYSSWSYQSIPHESLFPDLRQHDHSKKNCAVGCGPVAWAMIFGYYDRRSHDHTSTYGSGSQGLYRCGTDGTTGSNSCKSPSYSDSRMKKYLERLHSILGTFCLKGEGATLHGRMDRVDGFFKARQSSGSPDVRIHKIPIISFFGAYSSSIRNKMLNYVKNNWPVIVGIRVSGLFSQHYPVATKTRTRTKKERKCIKIFKWKVKCWWKTTTQHDMYLHMGWGGSQNGWRTAKTFFAGVAVY